jgi:hypothetical protein
MWLAMSQASSRLRTSTKAPRSASEVRMVAARGMVGSRRLDAVGARVR